MSTAGKETMKELCTRKFPDLSYRDALRALKAANPDLTHFINPEDALTPILEMSGDRLLSAAVPVLKPDDLSGANIYQTAALAFENTPTISLDSDTSKK